MLQSSFSSGLSIWLLLAGLAEQDVAAEATNNQEETGQHGGDETNDDGSERHVVDLLLTHTLHLFTEWHFIVDCLRQINCCSNAPTCCYSYIAQIKEDHGSTLRYFEASLAAVKHAVAAGAARLYELPQEPADQ